MSRFDPLTRDRPIVKGRAALLIVDVQNGTFGPAQARSKPEFHAAASARVIPNIRRLLEAFRRARLEVIYTVIENLHERRTRPQPRLQALRLRHRQGLVGGARG
jgi:nicotinamidase-related amidase